MKQPMTCLVQQDGESDEAFYQRVAKWVQNDAVRSRGDNREWTGSPPFHLDRSPQK